MALIYETDNFIVEAADKPHVTRTDGGHIRIMPKKPIVDRTELSPSLAKELIRLTMIVGEAMTKGMNNRGVDIGRINYQDNGNWTPTFHIHLYGRAKSAKIQKYGAAIQAPFRETGFYDNFEPLNEADIVEIRKRIEEISKRDKYKLENW